MTLCRNLSICIVFAISSLSNTERSVSKPISVPVTHTQELPIGLLTHQASHCNTKENHQYNRENKDLMFQHVFGKSQPQITFRLSGSTEIKIVAERSFLLFNSIANTWTLNYSGE